MLPKNSIYFRTQNKIILQTLPNNPLFSEHLSVTQPVEVARPQKKF